MIHIRRIQEADLAAAFVIINDAAQAYRGVIPSDRWHDPYMSMDELEKEIAAGIVFWVAEEGGHLVGVMGIQDKGDVALVRHAYTAPTVQRKGVGTTLLRHVQGLADKPVLIGTWADASWAIEFYRRNGFTIVSEKQKDTLLRKYWSIPVRQIETSVVLADRRWMEAFGRTSTAVLVIDVQQALCTGEYEAFEAKRVIDRINHVLREARAGAVPIFIIQHEAPGGVLQHGTDGWQLDADLDARPFDTYLRKTATDSFHNTDLHALLQGRGIEELVICGFQSEFCVDTTTRRALALGYPVSLVADGHSTLDNGVLTAAQITAHHNTTLANIESFGPRVRAIPASEMRFARQ